MAVDVFVVGALHLDVVVDAPHLPASDETVVGSSVAYRFGGKGGNQAVAAARFGAKVEMAGRIGRDEFGNRLRHFLDAAGVVSSQVTASPGSTGMSVAIVDSAGEYGAVIVSGVNGDIRYESIDLPSGLPVLLLQNEIAEEVNLALVRNADPSTCIVLNAAPARSVLIEIMKRIDVLVVNRVEAEAMVKNDAGSFDPSKAVEKLLEMGPRTVIVTLGSDGCVVGRTDGNIYSLPAHSVEVVSTHGAGDAFVGAFGADLARGAELGEAIRFAQAAAALIVSCDPDQRDRITAETVREFLGQL